MKNIYKYLVYIVLLLPFLLSLLLYSQMPESMASHWNIEGNVDGYMSKGWGLFMLPVLSLLMSLLLKFLPSIDPLKKNFESFKKEYDGFILFFLLFFLLIHLFTLLWNIGYEVSPNMVFPFGIGILFFYIGVLMGKAKMNWFIGIRNPWTLSSERVWNETHKIGGILFKVCGVISFLGILFPAISMYFVLLPILLASLGTSIYSYLLFKKYEKV